MTAEIWREDFSALALTHPTSTLRGGRLAFLDSAASAQKPRVVLDAVQAVWGGRYANVHRGLYANSETTTGVFEESRGVVARFLGAKPTELVWVRNATEGINLVAQAWARATLKAGDVVLVSAMEHHANVVPWQILEAQVGCVVRVIPLREDGALDMEAAHAMLAAGDVKLLAVTAMSNVTGVRVDVAALCAVAKKSGVRVLVDASQAAVHGPIDFHALGCDALVMTGHKLYGPTGIGVLLLREEFQAGMGPWMGGGDMIERVSWSGTTFASGPARWEAGTPAIGEAVGLAAACRYVEGMGWASIQAHEHAMAARLEEVLDEAGAVRLGVAGRGSGIASFNLPGCHASDVAVILDHCGVAVRSGHHCAMPLMETLGVETAVRASVALYTCEEDMVQLGEGLAKVKAMLG